MSFFHLQQKSRPAMTEYAALPLPVEKRLSKICRPMDSCNGEDVNPSTGMGATSLQTEPLADNSNPKPSAAVSTLEAELPRFGPAYGDDTEAITAVKIEAWEHILNDTPAEERSGLRGAYTSAIKSVEKEAKDAYDSSIFKRLKPSEFLWRMAIDGCFFLQLALHILGGSKQLNYPKDHVYLGSDKKDVNKWIKAMYFVGNQIPCVVIRELMNQDFFQKVVREGTWGIPSDLPTLVLYLVVVSPELEKIGRKGQAATVFAEVPIDILHGLYSLILGPQNDPHDSENDGHHDPEASVDDDADLDLEAGTEDANDKFPSASELEQSGITIRKARHGVREIHFRNKFWIFPNLYVPPFTFNGNTKLILHHLMTYETTQQQTKDKREVCAYILFMGDLVQTEKDVHILESKGIIEVKKKLDKVRLPGLLKRLRSSGKMVLTQNLRLTRLMVTEYKSLPWHLISLALFLTVVQTVFTILSYVMPRN